MKLRLQESINKIIARLISYKTKNISTENEGVINRKHYLMPTLILSSGYKGL